MPSADVTYSDTTSNHDVTWTKSGSGNATVSQQTGLITFNATSGSITITVTTNTLDQNDQAIVKTFTVTWSNFTRKLSSITVTDYTDSYVKDSSFTFDGTVTAHYNDNSEEVIQSGYVVDSSLLDMTTAGTYNVSVSYTEGDITKTVTIQITVTDGSTPPPSYVYERVTDAANLHAGDILLFGCASKTAVAGALHNNGYLYSEAATFDGSTVTDKGNGIEFTLGGTTDAWTFSTSTGTLYAKSNKDLTYSSDSPNLSTFTISINNNGNAVVTCTTSSYGQIQYNASSPRFKTYAAGQTAIQLYKKTQSVTPSKTLSSIALSGTYPTTFTQGDEFSHEGMTVTATYSDATTADVTTSATFAGYNMSNTGTQTVTVSYTESGVTESATYTITIGARTLSSISVSGQTTAFVQGGTFSFGGTVTATYNNGSTADVTASATFSGYNLSQTGEQTVTVSYTEGGVEKTTTYTITVSAEAQEQSATMQYTGSVTGNLLGDGANNASTVGLSSSLFNVTATKRTTGSSNFPGYNKDGTIRIYGQENCTITVEVLGGHTINRIVVNVKSNGTCLVILVDGDAVTGSNGEYTINDTSFTITHSLDNTTQIQINSVTIYYT